MLKKKKLRPRLKGRLIIRCKECKKPLTSNDEFQDPTTIEAQLEFASKGICADCVIKYIEEDE